MVHMVLAGLAMVFLVTGFHYVYCFSGVQRAYLGLYKGIVEEAVVVADERGNYLSRPLIYMPRLEALLEDYLDTELRPYCRSYEYAVKQKGSAIHAKAVNKVVITLNAVIDDVHRFEKSAIFAIGEGNHD